MLRALWVLLFLFSGNVKASQYDIDEIPEAPYVLFLRLTTQDIAAQSRKEEIHEFRDLILVFFRRRQSCLSFSSSSDIDKEEIL